MSFHLRVAREIKKRLGYRDIINTREFVRARARAFTSGTLRPPPLILLLFSSLSPGKEEKRATNGGVSKGPPRRVLNSLRRIYPAE